MVIRVARENVYQNAMGEGCCAICMSWPARQMEVVPLPEDAVEETSERPFTEEEREHRAFWSKLFGG